MLQADNEAAANKDLVLRFIGFAQVGDAEQMGELLTEDCVQLFPRPGVPGMPAGAFSRTEILGFLSQLSVYQAGSKQLEIERVIAEGPLVAIQFKMRAITSRGEPYENFYVQFIECRDGKIAKLWEYCDTLYAARKLMPHALGAPAS